MLYDTYNNGMMQLASGLDWENDTLKIAAFSSSYSPDIDADEYFDDISANEVSGGSYVAGGVALDTPVRSVDNDNDLIVVDATNQTLTGMPTFQTLVLYKDTGDPSTSPLICYWDNEAEVIGVTNVNLTYHASGIMALTKAGFGF